MSSLSLQLLPQFFCCYLILFCHGNQVRFYELNVVCIILLIHAELPHVYLVVGGSCRPSAQYCALCDRLAGDFQVYHQFTFFTIPCPVASGLVIISNVQSKHVHYLLPDSCAVLLHPSWVPGVAECIPVAEEFCAASLLNEYVPEYFRHMPIPDLHISMIININNPHYLLPSSWNISHNDIVTCAPAQVCLLGGCQVTALAHCCVNSVLFPNLVCSNPDCTSSIFPWRL